MCLLCNMYQNGELHDKTFTGEGYRFHYRVLEAQAEGMSLVDFMKGKPRWGSLHGHSEFSLLDGGAKVEDIFKKALAMGQDFVAITDHGNLFGAVKAHKMAKEYGIKHIVGSELYITDPNDTMYRRDYEKGQRAYNHLVTLAKNNIGYKNLCTLSSTGYIEGFYRQPRIDKETLLAHKEGLIVSTSCVGGTIPQLILAGQLKEAEREFEWYCKNFGDDFFVEVQNHGIDDEKIAFDVIRKFAMDYKVPMVATTDAHYLNEEDMVTHDALLCLGTGQKVDQEERKFKFDGRGYWYMAEEEVYDFFKGEEEAIYNAGFIADKIEDRVIEFGNVNLPHYDVPQDEEFDAWEKMGGVSRWV